MKRACLVIGIAGLLSLAASCSNTEVDKELRVDLSELTEQQLKDGIQEWYQEALMAGLYSRGTWKASLVIIYQNELERRAEGR